MMAEEWNIHNLENFAGFFGLFSEEDPDLARVFEGVPLGELIEPRIRACYAATKNQPPGSFYFLPPGNQSTTNAQIEAGVRTHLASFAAICCHQNETELAEILENVELAWVEKIEYDSSTNTPNTWLYEVICDFGFGLEEHDSPLPILREAFYSLSNDPYLQKYLMWPLKKNPPFPDPFAPYFWLWSEGVSLDLVSERECQIARSF